MNESEMLKLYGKAIEHVKFHHCSAKPYEYGKQLYELVLEQKPNRILEIGTGIGYATALLAKASPEARIQTIERNREHVEAATKFLADHLTNHRIEIIEGIAEQILPELPNPYDLIFFDGFGIHYEFLPQYQRLLLTEGLAVIANNHLKSKTSDKFFHELHHSPAWKIIKQFGDTTVARRVQN
jgi:predicted O-methyltransferase YrrM